MQNNRRDYFTDSVLGALLSAINVPAPQVNLSSVFTAPEQCNDTSMPYVMYGLLDERRTHGGETLADDISSSSRFTVLAYVWSAADATASGVLRGQVNQTVDLIEKALGDGDISNMQFADTDGTIVVWSVRVDSITAVPDFGDGMAAVAVNGSIWWNK